MTLSVAYMFTFYYEKRLMISYSSQKKKYNSIMIKWKMQCWRWPATCTCSGGPCKDLWHCQGELPVLLPRGRGCYPLDSNTAFWLRTVAGGLCRSAQSWASLHVLGSYYKQTQKLYYSGAPQKWSPMKLYLDSWLPYHFTSVIRRTCYVVQNVSVLSQGRRQQVESVGAEYFCLRTMLHQRAFCGDQCMSCS